MFLVGFEKENLVNLLENKNKTKQNKQTNCYNYFKC